MAISKKMAGMGKVVAAAAASSISGDPKVIIATALSETLSVALDSFSDVSQKRTRELFDRPELVERVVSEVQKSDDFASLVFNLWKRYNYESSETRRKFLKSILEKASYEEVRNYENFSKIFLVAEQITNSELIVLEVFYRPDTYEFSGNRTSPEDFQINVSELQVMFNDKHILFPEEEQLAEALTQLGNYGLITERPATIGGPYYARRRFGRIFLDYIES